MIVYRDIRLKEQVCFCCQSKIKLKAITFYENRTKQTKRAGRDNCAIRYGRTVILCIKCRNELSHNLIEMDGSDDIGSL